MEPNAYEIAAEIGKGAYGTVYKARDMSNQGAYVALKEIRIMSRSEEGLPMSTIREIGMLRQLEKYEHPNIVRLLDVIPGRQSLHEMKLMLVFEHVDQDLASYLEKCPSCGLGPDNIRELMVQIMRGVDFLHTNRIVHRDLKPQNILVTSTGRVKIADFGLARIYAFTMALTSVVVTLYYRAPEVLLQDTYCTAVDIWSCGAIFAELHLRRPLFQGTSEIDQLCKIFHIMGLPSAEEWPGQVSVPRTSFKDKPKQPLEKYITNMDANARDVLEKMLLFDQKKRHSAAAILRHAYFTDTETSSPDRDHSAGSSADRDALDMSVSSVGTSSSSMSSSLGGHDTSGSSTVSSMDVRSPQKNAGGSENTEMKMEGSSSQLTGPLPPNLGSLHLKDAKIAPQNPYAGLQNHNMQAQTQHKQAPPTEAANAREQQSQSTVSQAQNIISDVQQSEHIAAENSSQASLMVVHKSPEKRPTSSPMSQCSPVVSSPVPPLGPHNTACKELPNGYHHDDGTSPSKRGTKRSRPY